MKIKIDNDIRMPKPKKHPESAQIWEAIKTLDVGQSFVLPDSSYTILMVGNANRELSPKRFTGKALHDGNRRIWRMI